MRNKQTWGSWPAEKKRWLPGTNSLQRRVDIGNGEPSMMMDLVLIAIPGAAPGPAAAPGPGPGPAATTTSEMDSASSELERFFWVRSKPGSTRAANSSEELPPAVRLQPQCEQRMGVEVMWQMPCGASAVQGTLFIAAGWKGRPGDFWDASPGCPQCAGLPEERAITLAALRRGYAVVCVASAGAFWAKSRPACANRDVRNVTAVLAAWRREHGVEGLPLAGLGISDGGSFLPLLALETRCFSSLVIMISRGNEEAVRAACRAAAAASFPPTLFIEMPADRETSRSVGEHVAMLREAGVETGRVQCHPLRMHDSFFAERIPGLDAATSAGLLRALKGRRHVDERGYFVSPSPQAADWEFVRAWDWAPLVDGLGVPPRWSRAVEQQLSLAFGFHCPTSLKSSLMLDWLTGKTRCLMNE